MSRFPTINEKDRYVNVELTSNTATFYRTLNRSQYSDYTRRKISEEQDEEYPEFRKIYDNLNTVIPDLYDSSSNLGGPDLSQSPRKRKKPDTPDSGVPDTPNAGQGSGVPYTPNTGQSSRNIRKY
jgi:hypothetical protein